MLHIEGMEITRGTKNIIQESIEAINYDDRNNRNIICREFCRIVEDRYTGGAMSYQLRRMGNSYPISFLSENDWSIKDALDNNLLVYIDEALFFDKKYSFVNDTYYSVEKLAVESVLSEKSTSKLINDTDHVHLDELSDMNLQLVKSLGDFHPENVKLVNVLVPASADETKLLKQKMYLFEPMFGQSHSEDEIININKEQATSTGLLTAITSSVKVPLDTTAPILEAIDKHLYDTTGEYQV